MEERLRKHLQPRVTNPTCAARWSITNTAKPDLRVSISHLRLEIAIEQAFQYEVPGDGLAQASQQWADIPHRRGYQSSH